MGMPNRYCSVCGDPFDGVDDDDSDEVENTEVSLLVFC